MKQAYWITIAFRNVMRNKRRSILSGISISVAVLMIIIFKGFIDGMLDSAIRTAARTESGHIKIIHKQFYEYKDEFPLEYAVEAAPSKTLQETFKDLYNSDIPLKNIGYRTRFPLFIYRETKSLPALGFGMIPDAEKDILQLDQTIIDGRVFDPNKREMIMGSVLAEKLNITVGDKVTVMTRSAYESFKGITLKVVGISRFGINIIDSNMVFLGLNMTQKILELPSATSEVILILDNIKDLDRSQDLVNNWLDNTFKDHQYRTISITKDSQLVGMFTMGKKLHMIIYVIFLLLASTVIINTMMMVIFERIKEIGVMGALGMTRREIIQLFLYEALIISSVASLLGSIFGGAIMLSFSKIGVNLSKMMGGNLEMALENIVYPPFDLGVILLVFFFGIAISTGCSMIPSLLSTKLEPYEALRRT